MYISKWLNTLTSVAVNYHTHSVACVPYLWIRISISIVQCTPNNMPQCLQCWQIHSPNNMGHSNFPNDWSYDIVIPFLCFTALYTVDVLHSTSCTDHPQPPALITYRTAWGQGSTDTSLYRLMHFNKNRQHETSIDQAELLGKHLHNTDNKTWQMAHIYVTWFMATCTHRALLLVSRQI